MDIYRPQTQSTTLRGERISMQDVMRQVYGWMTAGLLTSAVVAVLFVVTGLTAAIGSMFMLLVLVEIFLVIWLSARIFEMAPQRASRLFIAYAALNGATLSTVFYWADLADIYLALFATGAMFAAMSIIGYTTETDLTRFRSWLMMGLIGVIVGSLINLFVASSALYWLVTYLGVVVFVGLTAYDTQWIKKVAHQLDVQGTGSGEAIVRRVAIIGALHLYLDFINLFIYMLRILSSNRR